MATKIELEKSRNALVNGKAKLESANRADSPDCGKIPARILLVGDGNRDSLYLLLEREGYDVLAVSNGRDAVAACRRSIHPIDLLITDYAMPRTSGPELARKCGRLCAGLRVLYVLASES